MKHILAALVLVISAGASDAFAWGCDGHRAIAILTERLLGPSVLAKVRTVLAASPIDPAIKPYCQPVPGDPIAEASTWADDNRTLDPSTAGWHFIDLPRVLGANLGDYRRYCRNGDCVVDAIASQYRILTTTTDSTAKGNALRYIIHFVGDLHQPLHTTTNGDRGGNCLAVTYYGQVPREDDFHNFRPNLHSIWDDSIIRRLMTTRGLSDARALADYAVRDRALRLVGAQAPTAAVVSSWAKEVSVLARTVTYGRLAVPVPMESSQAFAIANCDDNNHVGRRMAALNEKIDAAYESASVPVILSELRLAAERLASVLKMALRS